MVTADLRKQQNIMKKSIEDYYKSWVRKSFQKGVRDAKLYMGADCFVIIGYEVLSFMELSIVDDAYSKQVVSYSRKKAADKNYAVLKQNIEELSGREIESYYMDIDVDANISCMTFILKKEER